MKSYLSLITISGKKHKKQSRMTRICIILAVFLVTAMFSMAEMEMKCQLRQTIRDNGYWHLSICNLQQEQLDRLRDMSIIDVISVYGVTNFRLSQGYQVQGKDTIICAFDESFPKIYENIKIEGSIPTKPNEVMISAVMEKNLHKSIGDDITLSKNDGTETEYFITGITDNTPDLLANDCYGIVITIDGLKQFSEIDQKDFMCYVKFKNHVPLRKSINQVKEMLEGTDAKVGENIKLLGIMGKSKDAYMMQLYITASVLALLVVMAGILMITSNINSSLEKRTEFFGLLRCQGATKRQIKTFVVLEALNWCKTAIPIGILLGSGVSCVLCAVLRYLSPDYFSEMPILAVSGMGMISGCVVGIVTVLLAAISPAKKASKVSPLKAISGNAYSSEQKYSKIHLGLLPVEMKLGIHHAYKSKKNLILMVSSFALSIILFLAFSIGIDFLHHALRPVQVYAPDLSVYTKDNSCSLDKEIADEIKRMPGVKNVYGRSFAYNITAKRNQKTDISIHLLSYEEKQFDWSKKKVTKGSLEAIQSGNEVMTVFDANNPLTVGDVITINTPMGEKQAVIGAVLTDSPFTSDEGIQTVICSEETFEKLTGEKQYTIIDIQLAANVSEQTVQQIHDMFSDGCVFSDQREGQKSARGAYLSMAVFIYGFIAIIALISVFQIINSVAISVNTRIHEYGTMRAIGTSDAQITRMIIAEAAMYGILGIVFGCMVGIPLHYLLFQAVIASRWGDLWKLPISLLGIIIILIIIACMLAVYRPIKEIRKMSIVETITTY